MVECARAVYFFKRWLPPRASEVLMRLIITALVASVTFSMASTSLGAGDLHADSSSSKQGAAPKTMDRASFVAGAVHLNENASQCTSLPPNGARQRIVDIALAEWATFGYQSVDVSKRPVRLVRGFPWPSAPTPRIKAEQRLLARIAGFWAAVPSFGNIDEQNRRWKTAPAQEWRDHWSAAFTSWTACEAGLSSVQFARNVQHAKYIEYAMEDGRSAFGLMPAGALPKPGDLLCANEGGSIPGNSGFDPHDPKSLSGFHRLHCYVVAASDKAVTYVVGGNVVDWSKTPLGEFGSVGLLIVDNSSIAAMGRSMPCDDSRPCWLLGLGLKTDEEATYEKSPLTAAGRAMFNRADTTRQQP
jgi:hypothetical protein